MTQMRQIFTDFFFLILTIDRVAQIKDLWSSVKSVSSVCHNTHKASRYTVPASSSSVSAPIRSNFVSVRAVWIRLPG